MPKSQHSKIIFISCFLFLSCNTEYKSVRKAVLNLPPNKLISKQQQGSSGVTSKIDSLSDGNISSNDRLTLILELNNQLKISFQSYKQNRLKDNYDKVITTLNKISIDKDIRVKTKIKTVIPGAIVRYRTQAGVEDITANNPTNDCYVNFYIGNYFIWTERDDKKTSVPKKYFISTADSITISEKRVK